MHREDGPAIEWADGSKEWYKEGKRHRDDGEPAVEYTYGKKEWYKEGLRHRDEGPAVELPSGEKEYWLDGIKYTKKKYNEKIKIKENDKFVMQRDGYGITEKEYEKIKKYLETGKYIEAIGYIYNIATEKENVYGKKIGGHKDIAEILKKYAFEEKEHFILYTLNTRLSIIGEYVINIGNYDRTIVETREIFKKALEDKAYGIIVAHNHPSGGVDFSVEDLGITERLKQQSEILNIKMLDSFVVSYDIKKNKILVNSSTANEIVEINIDNKKEITNEI